MELRRYKFRYYEVSAIDGTNCLSLLQDLAKICIEKENEEFEYKVSFKLHQTTSTSNKRRKNRSNGDDGAKCSC